MRAPAKNPAVMARRRSVLQWYCEGKSKSSISAILGASERVVKSDVAWWMEALDAHEKGFLCARATARGLIDVSRVAVLALLLSGGIVTDDKAVKRRTKIHTELRVRA